MENYELAGFYPHTVTESSNTVLNPAIFDHLFPVVRIDGKHYSPIATDWNHSDLVVVDSDEPFISIPSGYSIAEGHLVAVVGSKFASDAIFMSSLGDFYFTMDGWNVLDDGNYWRLDTMENLQRSATQLARVIIRLADTLQARNNPVSVTFIPKVLDFYTRITLPWEKDLIEFQAAAFVHLGLDEQYQALRNKALLVGFNGIKVHDEPIWSIEK